MCLLQEGLVQEISLTGLLAVVCLSGLAEISMDNFLVLQIVVPWQALVQISYRHQVALNYSRNFIGCLHVLTYTALFACGRLVC